ncbi:TrkA family potassium uptake protein [Synechococcus sp. PCC 6312]|uniref:potassium channel family protein n=1 Tax=Synechococcus sp. (strain ATCC 27167 / PCC 6312) TaxID=195253 RepID=UPI00029EC5CE|nr:NAD-binding protein [Synechococcus sp. PCC 6312]AFY62252.1 K+ transport system, NAD-binding component [Synechococcus sp. PCC 6312]
METLPADLAELNNHVILCGFGYLGRSLAEQLAQAQIPFVVIDASVANLEIAAEMGFLTYVGDDVMDETELLAVGINRASTLATVLPNDASNVFITLTARGLNPQLQILARGDLPETEAKLRLAGADHVILPATISAHRMVQLITRPTILNFLEARAERSHLIELLTQLEVEIEEFTLPPDSPLVGLALEDLEAKAKGMMLVIALRHRNDEMQTHLKPDDRLGPEDTLITVGRKEEIRLFLQQNAYRYQMRYRGRKI